jgi:hypothetical protein
MWVLKELPVDIARALLHVGETSLHTPRELRDDDPDEGHDEFRVGSPYYWRRGLTREQRRQFQEAERDTDRTPGAVDEDDDADQPWNYVLIYRERTFRERIVLRRGYGLVVLTIVHNRNLGFELGRLDES